MLALSCKIIENNIIAAGWRETGGICVEAMRDVRDSAMRAGVGEKCIDLMAALSFQMKESSNGGSGSAIYMELALAAMSLMCICVAPVSIECAVASEPAKDTAMKAVVYVTELIRNANHENPSPLTAPFIIEACLFYEVRAEGARDSCWE